MKKQVIMMVLVSLALPLMAQETNTVNQSEPEAAPVPPVEKEQKERQKSREGRRSEFKKRQLKLMEKALNQIGVSEEQRQQIITLQQAHMEKMKANWKRTNKARRELSRLQDIGAGMEELEAAIQEVSHAQTEQLKILVHNRKAMEQILGKEKYDLMMKKAREFFEKHGRLSGTGLPPRPDVPPLPNKSGSSSLPPTPPTTNSLNTGVPPTP